MNKKIAEYAKPGILIALYCLWFVLAIYVDNYADAVLR